MNKNQDLDLAWCGAWSLDVFAVKNARYSLLAGRTVRLGEVRRRPLGTRQTGNMRTPQPVAHLNSTG